MLYDDPPHVSSTLSPAVSQDGGGGTKLTYSTTQSGIPCSINVASSSTREQFAQMGMFVDITVAYLASALTTPLVRGMKIADASGATFMVHGISTGLAYGSIPEFVYAHCERQLA